jgi:L-arabinokinase
LIESIRSSYKKCTELLRLPAHGDLAVFPNIVDIPLIGRRAKMQREKIRDDLGFYNNDGGRLVLLALRPNDLKDVNLAALEIQPRTRILTFGMGTSLPGGLDLAADAVPYQELVHASDLVISKPGYGIVSECFVNRTPMLFIERADFVECEVLVKWLQKNATCAQLPLQDFHEGRWSKHIESLLERPPIWKELPTNGDEIAAKKILEYLALSQNF